MGKHRGTTVLTAVGLGAALLVWRGAGPASVVGLYVAAVTAPLIAADVRVRRLPNRLVLPGYAFAGVGVLWEAVAARPVAAASARGSPSGPAWTTAAESVVCAGVVLGVMAALWAVGGVGMGDVKLAGVLTLAIVSTLCGVGESARVAVGIWLGAAFATVAVVGVVEECARRPGRARAGPGVRARGAATTRVGHEGRHIAFGPVLLGAFWAVIFVT